MAGHNTSDSGGHKRRPRYRGTHPRSYDQRYKELRGDADMLRHVRTRGRTPAGAHVSVLLEEVVANLKPGPGDIVADCTLGYGGHAMAFLRHILPGGVLVGLDVDSGELAKTQERLTRYVRQIREQDAHATHGRDPDGQAAHATVLRLCRSNFAALPRIVAQEGIEAFDIIFADLGVSSMQVDDPRRGISYRAPGPLDMRMDDRLPRTGADLLASLSRDELSRAMFELADEPDHERIAQWIVNQRQVRPIARTEELVRLVFAAKGTTEKAWKKRADYHDLHPAARTFQALRILVNDELGSLRELLRVAPQCLRAGGRLGVISFHSGEDRMVKTALRDGLAAGVWSSACEHVIRPGPRELAANPRSASAKFRWAIRAG